MVLSAIMRYLYLIYIYIINTTVYNQLHMGMGDGYCIKNGHDALMWKMML